MLDQQLLFGRRIPDPPYQHHSETSRDAAEKIKPSASTARARVLQYIRSRGAHGATDLEIQDALPMGGDTERPRRRELEKLGQIRDSGGKRAVVGSRRNTQAVVWVAVTSQSDRSEESD